VRFARQLRVDLGGIAKGYALDCAIGRLRESGVERALIDAGGDVAAFGPAVTIGIRDPRDPGRCALTLSLQEAALASSGRYFTADSHACALLDGRSRAPYRAGGAVSVRAPDGISADALTKVVLFAAPSIAEAALAACGAEAWLLSPAALAA
jgi:thiamine biosynthesis lipoprotein